MATAAAAAVRRKALRSSARRSTWRRSGVCRRSSKTGGSTVISLPLWPGSRADFSPADAVAPAEWLLADDQEHAGGEQDHAHEAATLSGFCVKPKAPTRSR